jgi:hypothetical protein
MIAVNFVTKDSRKIVSREIPEWAKDIIESVELFFADYNHDLEFDITLQMSSAHFRYSNANGTAYQYQRKIMVWQHSARKFVEDENGTWRNKKTGKRTRPTNDYDYGKLRHILAHEFAHFYFFYIEGDQRTNSQELERKCDTFAEMITNVHNPDYLSYYPSYNYP